MPTAASSIFDFLSRHENCSVQRYEIASASFGALRRAMASIIRHLRESQDHDANEISDQMRVLLFTWLTSPVEFNATIPEAIQSFGEPTVFEMRWGLRGEYMEALRAAANLTSEENPLRAKLRTVIRELRAAGIPFKIFCHRKARPHFDSLLVPSSDMCVDESCFLHSVRDYNNTPPFGALLKVGPLRSAGWGAVPDAVMSAPRFETLIQIVWSGCADEPGFGYDPVTSPMNHAANQNHAPAAHHDTLGNNVSWLRNITRSGEDPLATIEYTPGEDEFYILREPGQQGGRRPATFVEIAEGGGILYPPNSMILSFDPAPDIKLPFALRQIGETLTTEMFVILTHVGDVDFGNVLASEGRYSSIWKQQLNEEMQINPDGICRILRNNGVSLQSLRACVENWCQPSTTVIHAPQQKKHFEILIEALSIDAVANDKNNSAGLTWWQRAWNEIRISRGEAIQAGVQGHEVVEQQALNILTKLLSDVRRKAIASAGFRIAIPNGEELSGGFVFHKIIAIEEGYLVPETEIRVVRDLNTVEQWRMS